MTDAKPRSWPILAVSLLSFASGLPLGLVWIAIPTWLSFEGVDIRVVGLLTLAQAPWTLKPLWSPLMDRYAPPLLGRKRGWIFLMQVALLLLGLTLATRSGKDVLAVGLLALAIAVCSATLDIAYDGWTVEVLRREEQGTAVGARTAFYRAAMFASGRVSITAARDLGWAGVHLLTSLLYLPLLAVTWFAPEPETQSAPPRSLREAVFEPFVSMLRQHRALEILAFLVLYKLTDNLSQALTGPFLQQVGFDEVDIGLGVGTVGMAGIVAGSYLGARLSDVMGLGRSLWVFGLLQIFSNVGYAVVAVIGVNRPVMYAAQAFEMLASGLGTGCFGVLLLRLTERRFSATQFALFSSLFALPRALAGPPVGLMVDALGWRDFFLWSMVAGIPGLLMLQRFVPWGARDVEFRVADAPTGPPPSRASVAARGLATGVLAFAISVLCLGFLAAAKEWRQGRPASVKAQALGVLGPTGPAEVVTLLGALGFAGGCALAAAAATLARRRG